MRWRVFAATTALLLWLVPGHPSSVSSSATDLGDQQWVKLGSPGSSSIESFAINPGDQRTIFVGTWKDGVFKSIDGGINWSAVNAGLESLRVRALAFDPNNPNIVYAGTDGGLYKSINSGSSWSKIHGYTIFSVTVHPTDFAMLYMVAYDPKADTMNPARYLHLLRSTDAGLTFNPVLPRQFGEAEVLIPSRRPGTIYTNSGSRLQMSTDNGQTWTVVYESSGPDKPSLGTIAIDPHNPDRLFSERPSGGGFYTSTDNGRTWELRFKGSAKAQGKIAVNPYVPDALYIARIDPAQGLGFWGLYRSTDGGRAWSLVEGQPDIGHIPEVLTIDRNIPSNIYTRGSGGLVRYTDTTLKYPQDWSVLGGHFFRQTGPGNQQGYSVLDDAGASFWSEFQRLSGVETSGYPMSRRFVWDGFVTQVFQRAIFQWRPETNQVYFINVFDELSKKDLDDWLFTMRSTPNPLHPLFDTGKTWEEIVRDRLALLDANPAIKAKYYEVSDRIDPMLLYGLPTSRVTDMGNHYAIRLQRAVMQQWKEDVPWARAGQVTVANGGEIAAEAGLIPKDALQPEETPIN